MNDKLTAYIRFASCVYDSEYKDSNEVKSLMDSNRNVALDRDADIRLSLYVLLREISRIDEERGGNELYNRLELWGLKTLATEVGLLLSRKDVVESNQFTRSVSFPVGEGTFRKLDLAFDLNKRGLDTDIHLEYVFLAQISKEVSDDVIPKLLKEV